MKLMKPSHKKSKAQAMVEFAIALPVLLMLLYGLLETGRLLFMYSTVVTASRQAVRYGSATGIGNNSVPRYQDCDGIRAAAQKVSYLGAFDTVTILYDSGPATAPGSSGTCSGSTSNFQPKSDNTSRVQVEVIKKFTPIVPNLVPFIERDIKAISARTILVSVSIQVTSPPITFIASTPTFTPSPTPTPTLTFTPTRTPTTTNTPAVSFTPSGSAVPPTITLTPTITFTPTVSPTAVPFCNSVDILHGPITKSGNTMTMTITNPYAWPLTTGDGSVTWNDDKGHQTGGDKTLRLQSINIGGTTVWTGDSSSTSFMPWSTPGVIPANSTVTITFTFHQSYDNFDTTESIFVNIITNGCIGVQVTAP